MSMDIEGFDDLLGTLDKLGKVGDRVGIDAVKEGLKIVTEELGSSAPKKTGKSAKGLRIIRVKNYKSGNVWGKTGIDGKNWEQCKGLYYQNYGYENHINNKMVTKNVGWLVKAFEKSKDKASSAMINKVSKELDNILK